MDVMKRTSTEGPGVTIDFSNVKYTVRDNRSGAKLEILKGISGQVAANRLLAIMGSSGAGKTTLLDILAGNTFGSGVVEGEILVNGAPLARSEFSQISCYVLQRDVLLASSTVRESIMISALLKLPRSMAHAEKVARVDDILRDLDLEGCQHTLIGDELLNMKGISGGQRRRVSVGIELVKSPRVLFLDEPTSGLDSEMAVSLIETLVKLARQNRTVCTTIHQPNSLITSMFDDFLLLAGGQRVYYGPWGDAVSFFAASGFPCPQYTNPTDHFMSLLKEPDNVDKLVQAFDKQQGLALTGACASPDVEAGTAGEEGALVVAAGDGPRGPHQSGAEPLHIAPSVPWWYQVYVLSGRMFRMWWRNPAMLVSEASQYAFMAIFVGLMYLQLSNSLATGASDRAASIWFALAVLSFTPSYTAVTIWDKDRLLLRRESSQGMYNVTAWFAARTATTLPVEIIQTTLFCAIMYFMVGFVARADCFFIFLAGYCMFMLTSETIGVMAATVTSSSTYAILILTFVLLFLLSFSGFLVSDVPVYFKWIQKISYLTYTYAALMGNEFNHVTFYTRDGQPVSGSAVFNNEIPNFSLGNVNNGLSVGVNLAILLGITVGTRIMAFVLIYTLAKLKRL